MAQEAWKVLVQQRAKEAARRCARAHGPIAEVLGNLGTPDLVADVPAWLAWVPRAEVALADVSRDLAVAASLMAAAGLIAARAAAASPAPAAAAPPRSIDGGASGLLGGDEHQRSGLRGLQDARACAEKACDSVEESRAHLCAIRLLLDHQHLPGIHAGLHVMRASARRELDAAQKLEQETISLAHGVYLL
ncbi:hypothetical protein PVAP13_6KG175900 [Panicum virgatum]|uniref:Uncharacterized protein n=1 Tax=Panicum virgatum TaxID=38727 RepID=A0A8T0RC79_PANVG|nr:hypothetical protein PVAP13_6KG175900 [Panicum virgatum]KAG2582835.1 hypothetical protein PVAP13_6KG175900 [Panicum virgatum]KAG2582836.1 hypothetical protein PVAP13_6KG175900 [Panicum virgatum]